MGESKRYHTSYFRWYCFQKTYCSKWHFTCSKSWRFPITVARHAYGDVYKATEYRVPCSGKAQLVFTGIDGTKWSETIFDFDSAGVLQAQYNKDSSIKSFAHCCFEYALETHQDIWFASKDTISKIYDQTFKNIFQEISTQNIKSVSKKQGLNTSIHLLTMLLPALYVLKAVLYGLAKL